MRRYSRVLVPTAGQTPDPLYDKRGHSENKNRATQSALTETRIQYTVRLHLRSRQEPKEAQPVLDDDGDDAVVGLLNDILASERVRCASDVPAQTRQISQGDGMKVTDVPSTMDPDDDRQVRSRLNLAGCVYAATI